MNKVYYKKRPRRNFKKAVRYTGLSMFILGVIGLLYVAFPLLSWQFYFAAFASEGVISPVPEKQPDASMVSLLTTSSIPLAGVDYTHAENWYPNLDKDSEPGRVGTYSLSIPKINLMEAIVSTADTDLTKHMVQYNSTATPPEKGNAVVFGHSTLPQLYNPKDYKTILAKAYMLKKGDTVITTVKGVAYMYKIESITIVDAEDTSFFETKKDDSYLTIVTCTPPGTIWKRLILRARLQNL